MLSAERLGSVRLLGFRNVGRTNRSRKTHLVHEGVTTMSVEALGAYRETIDESEIKITPQAREQLTSLFA